MVRWGTSFPSTPTLAQGTRSERPWAGACNSSLWLHNPGPAPHPQPPAAAAEGPIVEGQLGEGPPAPGGTAK